MQVIKNSLSLLAVIYWYSGLGGERTDGTSCFSVVTALVWLLIMPLFNKVNSICYMAFGQLVQLLVELTSVSTAGGRLSVYIMVSGGFVEVD